MNYAGKVFAGDVFLGHIAANSMRGLTHRASMLCNRYFKPIDTMYLHRADGKEMEVKFVRINKLAPNNTVIRGKWQEEIIILEEENYGKI